MEYFITALLTSSISMSVIALLYIALEPLLAKKYAAKSIYYGWLIIILGLIIPFRPQFSKALIQINPTIANYTNTPVVNTEMDYVTNTIVENTSVITNSFQIKWFQIAFFIWLAGFAIFMFYYILRHIEFMKMINRWNDDIKSTQILNSLEELKGDMNITYKINIKMCPCISTPMLIGFYKPIILLPTNNLSDKEISLILRHELIHYKQKDLLYKVLMLMVIVIHWFNPIVYLIAKITSRQCEISCDEEVINYLDMNGRKLYAETIINASRKQTRYQIALSTNFYGGKNSMKKRINSIMNTKKKKLGFFILCFIITATITTGKVLATNNLDVKDGANENNTSKSEQTKMNFKEQKRKDKIEQDSAIYEKYGLTYDEDKDMFFYNGKTVRCFFDKLNDKNSFYFIIRPSGEINTKALRNEENELIGITVVSKEEFEKVFGKLFGERNNNQVAVQENKSIPNNVTKENYDKSRKDKIAKDYSIYEEYGLTYDKDKDMFYYKGEAVRSFFDKLNIDSYFFITRPKGNIDIKALRNEENKLIGIASVSKEEYDNLYNPTKSQEDTLDDKEL